MLAAWSASPARFREDANAEEDLVLGGYRDRVVIELAQNAADAATRAGVRGRLRLQLERGNLRAANTGAPIDAAGIESASTLRASSKRDDAGSAVVGRFGVGFAAVLAVTDEPVIVSRTGCVSWSRSRSREEISRIPSLVDELERRGDVVPVLRLPYATAAEQPPSGFDTEIVLPLRDSAAGDLAHELLDGVDAALLLALPALESVEVVVEGAVRRLESRPTPDGVVVDRMRWKLHRRTGDIDPALLRDRPVEEQARRHFSLVWALPVDDGGAPQPLPASVPPVAHAPTPTDAPVSLPALLIAPLPLDPTRRHVAAGPLREFLTEQAADAYVDLVRELPLRPASLTLVPTGIASGALDGGLRSRIVSQLREAPFLASFDDALRLRPSQALMLDDGRGVSDDELLRVLGNVLPALVPGEWVRVGQSALAALGVRRIALAEVIDELGTIERPPTWWHSLYAALAQARVSTDLLGGLPVPLASGELARSPRGVLMPGDVGDLSALGLRAVDPAAAHPLLSRLGAIDPDPASILAGERVRAAVENSYESDDPAAVADAVLRLVSASGVSIDEQPWLAELALPADDGELMVAGELLLPQGRIGSLVAPDSPFGMVDHALLERWGGDVLTSVGVLDNFALVHGLDVAEAQYDLDGEEEYLDLVSALLDADEPVVIDELVAVRDLEFVRADSWPQVLALLAMPPLRSAVIEPALASTSTQRMRVVSYTAWWLRNHRVVSGRLAASDMLLEGLYDVVDLELDEEFLAAVGALRQVSDADPDDLLARLADPARSVTRAQTRALYAAVTPSRAPGAVRAVRDGELVVIDATDAVIVDAPDLLPLLGSLGVVPAALADSERVADALDLPVASELAEFEVISAGETHADHVVHEALMVTDVDGVPTRVAWRLVDGVLHVDAGSYEYGLGRGRAWRSGDWTRRHLETELLRDPANGTRLLAEADLDPMS